MSVSDDTDLSQPFFPPELEQVIVEMAALEGIRFPLTPITCCLELQLTAKRFRDWTVPLLYQVLHTDKFYLNREESECLELLRKVGRCTSHIYIGTDPKWASKILEHCPNVENIVNWHIGVSLGDPSLHSSMQNISKLRRISALMQNVPLEFLISPVYANITHLDIMGWMDWDLLVNFHNLSHLCLTEPPSDITALVKRLTDEESGCRYLRVIVMLYYTWYECLDERFVKLRLSESYEAHEADWIRGVNGGMDFWEFADRIVSARKAGYLNNASTKVVYNPPPDFNLETELNEQGQLWWSKLSDL
ncbi:hypothetical protein BJ165DRAFT_1483511 [Panaeolus papilionaceus]|nr:hypothetical protein BJ165DRAFT_1483511 [Panaeolus papilionaceus]